MITAADVAEKGPVAQLLCHCLRAQVVALQKDDEYAAQAANTAGPSGASNAGRLRRTSMNML